MKFLKQKIPILIAIFLVLVYGGVAAALSGCPRQTSGMAQPPACFAFPLL